MMEDSTVPSVPSARPSSALIGADASVGPPISQGRKFSGEKIKFSGEKIVKIKVNFIAAVVALGASCASADPLQPSFDHTLPPAKINAIVQSMGLVPVEQPVRKGLTYVVIANNRLGRSVRIVVDARFGKVLSMQRVIAVIPPGAYPVRQPVDGTSIRPYAPGTPVIRPPDVVARPPAPLPVEKPDQKPTTAPASPIPAVVNIGTPSGKPVADPKAPGSASSQTPAIVNIGTSSAKPAADSKPTGGAPSPTPSIATIGTSSAKPVAAPKPPGSASSPSFPPVQSLE
jgi:hypothetical protein